MVQDYLLPTVAYIGGAAEIAYFAQSEVVYKHVLRRMPVILSRPDFTLVDIKAAKLLRAYKLNVEDIWAGSQEVRRRMELASVPMGLSIDFDRNHKQVIKMLDQLHDQLKKLDPYFARCGRDCSQKNRVSDRQAAPQDWPRAGRQSHSTCGV